MLKAIFNWFRQPDPKSLAPAVQPEAAPYKVEATVPVVPTAEPVPVVPTVPAVSKPVSQKPAAKKPAAKKPAPAKPAATKAPARTSRPKKAN